MKIFSISIAAFGALLLLVGSAPSFASTSQIAEYGCINCHGSYPRGEAPSLRGLADRMAKYRGDTAGLEKKVTKFRTGEALEHVDAHERISQETATRLLRWLSAGAQ